MSFCLTETQPVLKAPFPYFGGKSRVAHLVWERFGDVRNYVEPFFGSGAVLLARPTPFDGVETVNDADGMVANFWRALQHEPDAVARWADWPVNENDLHARHVWLVNQQESLQSRLDGDAEFYDAQAAGWWCWGMCCWIGDGFCSGTGPWQSVDGQLVHLGNAGRGINRQRVHIAGRGVNRKRVHLGNAGQCVNRKLVHLGDAGQGVNRKLVHLGDAGQGEYGGIYEWMQALAQRLRYVRVCSGDWSRVTGPSVTKKHGTAGIFLDPPYADTAKRHSDLYRKDSLDVAHKVRAWALERGDDPKMRIALCGYEGEHEMPESWACVAWKARGGYGNQSDGRGRENCHRERIWFSPHCLRPDAPAQEALL